MFLSSEIIVNEKYSEFKNEEIENHSEMKGNF